MSVAKIVSLVIYAVLAILALTQGDSTAGVWTLRLLVILAIAHTIETAVFFKLCQSAGGSLPGHLLNVFLFGVIHVGEIKAAQGKS
jgi:uncharacterized protein YhhL (DUF1145 family)